MAGASSEAGAESALQARAAERATPVALTIAGSDSGGGAGVAADLKAFAHCGVHGACVLTAVTAQSTMSVAAIHELPAGIVEAQFDAVLADLDVGAVKVGMLGGAAAAGAVARALARLAEAVPVVVDPVLVASTGARLLTPQAERILLGEIVPRATVLTPNLHEARALLGEPPQTARRRGASAADTVPGEDERAVADRLLEGLLALGPRAVVLTGGPGEDSPDEPDGGRVTDLFGMAGEDRAVEIAGARAPGGADHGSGCTHSALLAAELALGRGPLQAARRARELTGAAIAGGLRDVGAGNGPVDVIGLAALRAAELAVRPAS
ncbi:MAG: bifunctional hydroxymethylpyrimidine kinase/phosphomethylpyrimidine kinase [Acidobacteriota bacterium]|nr:bifunctional hydroxymethylpyrimidine kinase/phosphomethylpyrimidine kinase [Acidobacteriota bacterium]